MKIVKFISAAFLAFFGFLTLYLTISIILDLFGMREKNIGYTPFVIWVNFFCGIAYLIAAYGFFKSKYYTGKLLAITTVILFATFGIFNLYIQNGGIHKEDTFGALIFRTSITLIFTLIAYFVINKKHK